MLMSSMRSNKMRYITSRTSRGALRPGEVVPGEAHLVVAASSALDRHVELVPDSLVLLLKENLGKREKKEVRTEGRAGGKTATAAVGRCPDISSVSRSFWIPLPPEKLSPGYVKVANSDVCVCSLSDTADEGAETEEQQRGCRS